LPDNHPAPDLLGLIKEGQIARVAGLIAEGRFVDTDDVVAGLLKLDGEEEGCRDVLPLPVAGANTRFKASLYSFRLLLSTVMPTGRTYVCCESEDTALS
jgi:hypothetical protein